MEKVVIEVTADAKGIQDLIANFEKLKTAEQGTSKQMHDNLDKGKGKLREHQDEVGRLEAKMRNLGERIVAIFAVERIFEFAKESVKAFEEAETAARKLEFTITKVNGESDKALQGLIKQSEKLAAVNKNLYTTKQIQEAQQVLAIEKLSTDQIQKLMPVLLDYAAMTGKTLPEAANDFGKAISEGVTKPLISAGLKFKSTGDPMKDFNSLLENSSKLAGEAGEALDTYAGKAQQSANEVELLSEKLGKKLAPAWEAVKKGFLSYANTVVDFYSGGSNKAAMEKTFGEEAVKKMEKFGVTFSGFLKPFKQLSAELMPIDKAISDMEKSVDGLTEGYNNGTVSLGEYMLKLNEFNATSKLMKDKSISTGTKTEQENLQVLSNVYADAYDKMSKTLADFKGVKEENRQYDFAHEKDYSKVSIAELKRRLGILEDVTVRTTLDLKHFNAISREAEIKDIEAYFKKLEEADKKRAAEKAARIKKENDEIYKRAMKEMEELEKLSRLAETPSEKAAADFKKELIEAGIYGRKREELTGLEMQAMLGAEAKFNKEMKDIDDKARKEKLDADKKLFEEETNQLKLNAHQLLLDKKMTNDQYVIAVDKLNIGVLEREQQAGDDSIEMVQKIEKAKQQLQEDTQKQALEGLKKTVEGIKEFTDIIMKSLDETINGNIASIDTMLARQSGMIETQKVLASKGLANDLAFEQKRQDQLTAQKLNEQKKLKQAKELETFLNALAQFAEKDPSTALPKALGLLAATKIAEAAFAEEGGVVGNGMLMTGGRRHKSGKDRLVLAEDGEGILTTGEMSKMGGAAGFNAFRNMLKAPLREKPIGNSTQKDHGQEIVSRLESLEKTIKDKKELNVAWDTLDSRIEQTIERGVKDRVKNILKKPRL